MWGVLINLGNFWEDNLEEGIGFLRVYFFKESEVRILGLSLEWGILGLIESDLVEFLGFRGLINLGEDLSEDEGFLSFELRMRSIEQRI